MMVLYSEPLANSVEIIQTAKKAALLVLISWVFMIGLTFEKGRWGNLGEKSALSEMNYENGSFSLSGLP